MGRMAHGSKKAWVEWHMGRMVHESKGTEVEWVEKNMNQRVHWPNITEVENTCMRQTIQKSNGTWVKASMG